ncbi:hypothetical protein PT974_04526 [Cladobotryum mycophilum]|uniref:Uncharacterized protein n=1 Tax=Cladobotryum mycophilum TaxID=491253 RepID=A0ABR0SVF0_9HYPO
MKSTIATFLFILPALSSAGNILLQWQLGNGAPGGGIKEISFPINVTNAPATLEYLYIVMFDFDHSNSIQASIRIGPSVRQKDYSLNNVVFRSPEVSVVAPQPEEPNCREIRRFRHTQIECAVKIPKSYRPVYSLVVQHVSPGTWSRTLVDASTGDKTHISSWNMNRIRLSIEPMLKSSGLYIAGLNKNGNGKHPLCQDLPKTEVVFGNPTTTTGDIAPGTVKRRNIHNYLCNKADLATVTTSNTTEGLKMIIVPPGKDQRNVRECQQVAEQRAEWEDKRKASRPFYQFIYQLSAERKRIEDDINPPLPAQEVSPCDENNTEAEPCSNLAVGDSPAANQQTAPQQGPGWSLFGWSVFNRSESNQHETPSQDAPSRSLFAGSLTLDQHGTNPSNWSAQVQLSTFVPVSNSRHETTPTQVTSASLFNTHSTSNPPEYRRTTPKFGTRITQEATPSPSTGGSDNEVGEQTYTPRKPLFGSASIPKKQMTHFLIASFPKRPSPFTRPSILKPPTSPITEAPLRQASGSASKTCRRGTSTQPRRKVTFLLPPKIIYFTTPPPFTDSDDQVKTKKEEEVAPKGASWALPMNHTSA